MPMVMSSMMLGLMEMSILTVGEMLAMFPYLKELRERIGFLNQSVCPEIRKSLFSIVHKEAWVGL